MKVIVIGVFGTVTTGLLKGTGGFGSWRTNGDYPNDSIIEDGQNTEKSLGDLRRLEETIMWKTLKEYIKIIAKIKDSERKHKNLHLARASRK